MMYDSFFIVLFPFIHEPVSFRSRLKHDLYVKMNPNFHSLPRHSKKLLFTKNTVREIGDQQAPGLQLDNTSTGVQQQATRPRVFNPSQLTALMSCFNGDVGWRPSSVLAVTSINVG
jgi:hypothetical protein